MGKHELSYETESDVRIGGALAGPRKVIVDLDWPPKDGPYATLLREQAAQNALVIDTLEALKRTLPTPQ